MSIRREMVKGDDPTKRSRGEPILMRSGSHEGTIP